MNCACNNSFPRPKVVIRQPRLGTRCSVCCCRRMAYVEERYEHRAMRLCKRCLERVLDRYHELLANEHEQQRQAASRAGYEPQ